jgi:hypothetical protein
VVSAACSRSSTGRPAGMRTRSRSPEGTKLARVMRGTRSFRVARSACRQARVQRRRRCERCSKIANPLRTGGTSMSRAVAARMMTPAWRRSPTSPASHQNSQANAAMPASSTRYAQAGRSTVRVNRFPPLRCTSGRMMTGACSISEPTRAVRCPRICGTPCAVDATGAGCLSHHGPRFLPGASWPCARGRTARSRSPGRPPRCGRSGSRGWRPARPAAPACPLAPGSGRAA